MGLGIGVCAAAQGQGVGTALMQAMCDFADRWGQEVGSLEGRLEPWDGRTKSGQQVPEGTYFYVLEAEAVDGTALSRSGTLTLVR